MGPVGPVGPVVPPPGLAVAAAGLIHSWCHMKWPFVIETTGGFDETVSVVPDVFFHLVMLVFAWHSMRTLTRDHPTMSTPRS